jgi:hypothetical protein
MEKETQPDRNPGEQQQPGMSQIMPRCPHCYDPQYKDFGARLATQSLLMGPVNAAVFFCGNCGAILGMSVIEIRVPQQGQPSILLPS